MSGSSSTANLPAIPACSASSSVACPATAASGAGSRKTFPIAVAICSACSPSRWGPQLDSALDSGLGCLARRTLLISAAH
jgi:hypothetical protein